jgi:hypothetical protein
MHVVEWLMIHYICRSDLFDGIYDKCCTKFKENIEQTLAFFMSHYKKVHMSGDYVEVKTLLAYASIILNRIAETPLGKRFDDLIESGYAPLDQVVGTASLVFCLVCDCVMMFIDDEHHRHFDKRMSLLTRSTRSEYCSAEEKKLGLMAYRGMKINMLKFLGYSLYVEPMTFHSIFLTYTACDIVERPVKMVEGRSALADDLMYPIAKRRAIKAM